MNVSRKFNIRCMSDEKLVFQKTVDLNIFCKTGRETPGWSLISVVRFFRKKSTKLGIFTN